MAETNTKHPNHVLRNREIWGGEAPKYAERAVAQWAADEISWGVWSIPERDVKLLGNLDELRGRDVIELGCGTGYVSAWLSRLGANPIGVDVTPEQLATARAMQQKHGIDFPLVEASAEDVPLPDASCDLVISEYGAVLWCEPEAWLAEAARLLRPGGRLVMLTNSPLVMLCTEVDAVITDAAKEQLVRDQFGMHRLEWTDDTSVEFHVPHGKMIDFLREAGFNVERLVELQAPEGSKSEYDFVTYEWARRWPSEEAWVAVKA